MSCETNVMTCHERRGMKCLISILLGYDGANTTVIHVLKRNKGKRTKSILLINFLNLHQF